MILQLPVCAVTVTCKSLGSGFSWQHAVTNPAEEDEEGAEDGAAEEGAEEASEETELVTEETLDASELA